MHNLLSPGSRLFQGGRVQQLCQQVHAQGSYGIFVKYFANLKIYSKLSNCTSGIAVESLKGVSEMVLGRPVCSYSGELQQGDPNL